VTERDHAGWYRHIDAALLRASVHTGDMAPQLWPDLSDDAQMERWCAWLAQVWAQLPVAEAIAVASPVLAERVAAVCAGLRPGTRQVRRMIVALARYLVRMRGRATPFGAFAGVAALRFGPQVSVRWTDDHQLRTRADAVWLGDVIGRLESCAALRRRLPVMVNDLAFARGERLVVPWQPHAGRSGRWSSVEVSVRHAPAVQTIMHAARSPIQVGDLIDKLAAAFPDAPISALDAMVADLVGCGALITGLRPPSTSTDGLAHVLGQLQLVDAAAVREAAPLVAQLRVIHAQLQAVDCASAWADGRGRRAAATRMRALSAAAEQPLAMDLRLGCAVVLPMAVAAEAEWAAEALLRLTPAPAGCPAWREYHGRFLDRYGPGAVVAVGQLADPTVGLGFPRHYREPEWPAQAAGVSGRDERLLALAQQAALDGERELVLDDGAVGALAAGPGDTRAPVPHVDVWAEVQAPSVTALAEGRFTLVVCGIGRTAAAVGRVLDLFPDGDRRRMAGGYASLLPRVDGALVAQLSFPPHHPRVENAVRAPRLLPDVLSLAEHRASGQGHLPIRDLAVTADADGMYVVSLSRQCVVEPVLPQASARHTMPALARLLLEIPRATGAAVSPFDWGVAACLPFLPRIRYRRSILSRARWRIRANSLPSAAASQQEWTAAIDAMRARLRLPASVWVGAGDRQLRLNLDQPMDLALLRAHVRTTSGAVTLTEAPAAADHGWLSGRAHEIVVPMAAAAPPTRAPAVATCAASLPLVGAENGALPGSDILLAKVHAHPDVFDTILIGHLPRLLAMWDTPPPWWFTRYCRPAPHLRLRLHDVDYGQATVRLGRWANDLRQRGLIGDLTLDTYHPETGRYGSGPAMAAAETVFVADSAAALVQLAAVAGLRDVRPQALTAASLVDLAGAMMGGRPAGMRWLVEHQDFSGTTAVRDRDMLRQAIRLGGADTDRAALHILPGGPAVAAAWHARRQATAHYAARLTPAATHVKPASVLTSLLHMHHVRAHGISPDAEALTHRLARAIALYWQAGQTTNERPR
jgi:lantibiotic biosynthesis protein